MLNLILANLFPVEIAYIIIHFMKRLEATEVIKHYTNIISNRTISIKFVINKVVNSFNIIDSIDSILDNYIDLNESFIDHLQRVLTFNYSREKYNHIFWQCLLNILSRSLMNYYNYLTIHNKPTNIKLKNSNNYRLFKNSVSLCLKYNMKLCFYQNKNNKNNKNFLYEFVYV